MGSYNVSQVLPLSISRCPTTLSSPDWVTSPTRSCAGPGQGTSYLPTLLVSGVSGGSTSGGGETGGGGVSLVIINCSG